MEKESGYTEIKKTETELLKRTQDKRSNEVNSLNESYTDLMNMN